MSDFELTQINIFPVKSLGGITIHRAELTDRGLEHDRRWMLVDAQGTFLTQREIPRMAWLNVSLQPDRLVVQHVLHADDSLEVSPNHLTESTTDVTIWKSVCPAIVYCKEVNDWFSRHLDVECRLVFMPDESRRDVDPLYRQNSEIVSFADGFPSLVIGEASLADLNCRLPEPVPMDRFRTNLVFSGGAAFAEDGWKRIRVGEIEFRVVKPCARCVMTTIDPETAEKGVEPMRTLSTYRRTDDGKVMFGQNLLHNSTGTLEVGMPLEVLE